MTDEPSHDPTVHTEVHRVADPASTRVAGYLANPDEVHHVAQPGATRVAGYLAEPDEVGRVLLLYSGGLDTSVMLKWIQDEYEAEVVALTVNLGQPGEDYDVVRRALLEQRLVLNATGPQTIRLLPPLIIDEAQADDALARLRAVLGG